MVNELFGIGTRIKEERERHNKTREDLANLLGVTVGTILAYESGMRVIRPEQLYAIAEYLEVPVISFFYKSGEDGIRLLVHTIMREVLSKLNIKVPPFFLFGENANPSSMTEQYLDEKDVLLAQRITEDVTNKVLHDLLISDFYTMAIELYSRHINITTLKRLINAYEAFTKD